MQKKKKISCKFICWKEVVPGHNQGTPATKYICSAQQLNPYAHNRIPGCPPPYIFINYFLKKKISIWAPGSLRFDFFRSYLIGDLCKKQFFACKFICWKKVVPGHNQGTRVPTKQKFI